MYTANAFNSQWDILSGAKSGSASGSSGAFDVFGTSFKEMMANKTGIQDMLAKLADSFPNASVSAGKPEAGVEGKDKYFGKDAGDHVAVDESLLAGMFGNGNLAQTVQDAIAAFLNSDAGSNNVAGAYTQRTISITITTVTFNVNQRAEGSGELLSGQELQTAFQEKLQELINRVFGINTGSSAAADETDESETAEAASTDNTTNAASKAAASYQSMMFSMELFFSSNFINNMGGQSGSQSMAFSMSYASYSGSFQDFASNSLPQSIYQALSASGSLSGNGPFTSLLEGSLSQFGMTSNGYGSVQGGFSFKMSQSTNLLAELMELFASKNRPAPAAGETYETDETAEAEDVAEAAETTAE